MVDKHRMPRSGERGRGEVQEKKQWAAPSEREKVKVQPRREGPVQTPGL
jgi:hypothetical protein